MSALQITYQIQLAEGQTIAFEVGADTDDGAEKLRETLDMVGGAAERRKAIHDLPFHKARLFSNRELLVQQHKARAVAEAQANAKVAQLNAKRRGEVAMMPMDANAIAQYDSRIMEIEKTIKGDELRVPYLEAIIAGREPPDLFPEAKNPEFLAAAE